MTGRVCIKSKKEMTMGITNKAIRTRVKKGMAFLDNSLGKSWSDHINLNELDMSSGQYAPQHECGCIIAQLDWTFDRVEDEGEYDHGLRVLEIDHDSGQAEDLGFFSDTYDNYTKLTQAWKEEMYEQSRT